jgi:hypothetical protein
MRADLPRGTITLLFPHIALGYIELPQIEP